MWFDLKILGTLVLMVAGGTCTSMMALSALMNLGLRRHDNYEYYGVNYTFLSLVVIVGAGIIGFVIPGVAAWHLHTRGFPRQFSLRTLLIAMTLIAVVLGAVAKIVGVI